jgi:lysophospholipase L1-like esterase
MLRIALASLTVALAAATASADDFFFKDGDRVVMIGDSITEQHLYSNYVEMWVTTRFPHWNITFRNVGIGGDTGTGGNNRFKRDVLARKPTALTVDFGMNDGGYGGFVESRYNSYMKGLQGMADQAKAAGIRVAWCTPQPLDNADQGPSAITLPPYNQTLERFSAGVKEIAEKNGGLFVDQFHPYLAVLDKARKGDAKYTRITAGDAVHPGPPGQALMAACILKGLRFPTAVSSVEIRVAGTDASATAVGCKVTEVKFAGGSVSFQRQDAALPFFPDEAKAILKWSPIVEELNQYGLKVAGLAPGKYEVRLGGRTVAQYTDEELGRGVNLAGPALSAGPVADQVRAIKKAIEDKNRFHHTRIFRGVVLANVGSLPDWLGVTLTAAEIEAKRKAAYDERMAMMPELDAAVKRLLEIKPHTVEIAPVK